MKKQLSIFVGVIIVLLNLVFASFFGLATLFQGFSDSPQPYSFVPLILVLLSLFLAMMTIVCLVKVNKKEQNSRDVRIFTNIFRGIEVVDVLLMAYLAFIGHY